MTGVAAGTLQPHDIIHIGPHQVFRHTEFIHNVACRETDVEVEAVITVGSVIVICWAAHPGSQCGAVVYDRDDTILREVAA